MNEVFELRDRRKKKGRQLNPRWMGMLRNAKLQYERGKVILFCKTCDDSTPHFPVRRSMKQVNNKFVLSNKKLSTKKTFLKCKECGRLEKNVKKLAY